MRVFNKHLFDCCVLSYITVQFIQGTLGLCWHLKFVKDLVSKYPEPTCVFQECAAGRHEAAPRSMNFFPWWQEFSKGGLNKSWLSLAWCRKTWVNDYWPRPLLVHFHAWKMFDQIRKLFYFNHCELLVCCFLRPPLSKHDAAIYDLGMFNIVLRRVFL